MEDKGYRVCNLKLMIFITNLKISIKRFFGYYNKPKIKKLTLEDIFNIEDSNDLLVELHTYLYEKKLEGIKLNTIETDILALMTFVMETSSGGYSGFVYHSGNLYHETLKALKKINCINELESLTTLLDFFPNKKVPKDSNKRDELLTEEFEIACSNLDNTFNRDMIIDLTYQYLLINKSKIN